MITQITRETLHEARHAPEDIDGTFRAFGFDAFPPSRRSSSRKLSAELEEVATALKYLDDEAARKEYTMMAFFGLSGKARLKWSELMAIDIEELRSYPELAKILDRHEGRVSAKGEAKAVLRLLGNRAIALTDEQRELILNCTDQATLGRWLDAVYDVATADELFG